MTRQRPRRPHGHYRRYHDGCRCTACRIGYNTYYRNHDLGEPPPSLKVDVTPTTRRLAALACAGHTKRAISDTIRALTGMSVCPVRLRELARMPAGGRILDTTAADIDIAYRRPIGTRPTGPQADAARTWAAKRRLVPDAAWDNIDDLGETPKLGRKSATVLDEEFIELALTGDRTVAELLSGPERRAAIRRARERQMPEAAVANLFAISERTRLRMVAAGRTSDEIESAA